MNGTVPLSETISAFTCKEMRTTVRKKIEEANKNVEIPIRYTESESVLYESINEVPIMKDC